MNSKLVFALLLATAGLWMQSVAADAGPVASFASDRATYTWHGETGWATNWTARLAAQLTARLQGSLGTAATVTGEVCFHDVQPAGDGSAQPTNDALFAEIAYHVQTAPAGEVAWADVVKIDAAAFAVADLTTFAEATAETAARSIADALLANLVPFTIGECAPDGQFLICGGGGTALRVGECLTVFARNVDETEAVGTVQIIRVVDRGGIARRVEGDAAKMVVGAHLRRVPLGTAF